jgi:hypothetical protein
MIMSTGFAATDLRPGGGLVETLFGRGRQIWNALAEGKAAADRYQSLVGKGLALDAAAETVFREHFGKR